MDYVLIVDDDETIISIIENKLYECINDIEIVSTSDYHETEKLLATYPFKIAILDVTLPDAPHGEIINLITGKGIASIVLTGLMDEETKQIILDKDIIEFVSKNDPKNINYVTKVTKRLLQNYKTKVLIVNSSKSQRDMIAVCLRRLNLQVFEASNGIEALELIERSHNTISLVLTDYMMPQMNGMDLTTKLRESYNKDQLCIIAVSGTEDGDISTKFLKRGANDYIKMPFTQDEITVRVNANLEMLDLLQNASDLANKDYLTGAYNRRFFFESGKAILKKAIRNKKSIFIAMLDIDDFKQINDTFGHDIGDEAIKVFSNYLTQSFRSSDLVARFGGEEFCVLLEDIAPEKVVELFENIRKHFESQTIIVGPHELQFTLSIGIFHGILDELDDMIKEADMGLYLAKDSGRNICVLNAEKIG